MLAATFKHQHELTARISQKNMLPSLFAGLVKSCTHSRGIFYLEKSEIKKRIIALQQEHRDLDDVIAALADKGAHAQLQLQRMKKRKLALRDFINRLEALLVPDIIA